MDISYYEKPFAYSIIDNFFDYKLLTKVLNYTSEVECGLSKLPENIEKVIRNDYCPKLEEVRNELLKTMPEPWDSNDTKSDYIIWCNKMTPLSEYKIHQDSEWKRLSVVVYLGDTNSGTLFHESKDSTTPQSEVKWKHNRAFAFVPGNNTWHSYRNTRENPRETVLINMGDAKHPVFSAENKLKY